MTREHIGGRGIGAEFTNHCPHHFFCLFFAETLDLPGNLPMVGRSVDKIVRLRHVLPRPEALDSLRSVFVEIEVQMPDRRNVATSSAAGLRI